MEVERKDIVEAEVSKKAAKITKQEETTPGTEGDTF